MSWHVLLAVSLAIGLAVAVLRSKRSARRVVQSLQHADFSPVITRVQSLGEVVTAKVHLADVLTASDDGFKGAWIIRGDALIAVDLTLAAMPADRVDEMRRTATVVLPRPHVLQPRVDHARTETYDIRRIGWSWWKGDRDKLCDLAMKSAQERIRADAESLSMIDLGRRAAEKLISLIGDTLDWTVTVEWQDRPTPTDQQPRELASAPEESRHLISSIVDGSRQNQYVLPVR